MQQIAVIMYDISYCLQLKRNDFGTLSVWWEIVIAIALWDIKPPATACLAVFFSRQSSPVNGDRKPMCHWIEVAGVFWLREWALESARYRVKILFTCVTLDMLYNLESFSLFTLNWRWSYSGLRVWMWRLNDRVYRRSSRCIVATVKSFFG